MCCSLSRCSGVLRCCWCLMCVDGLWVLGALFCPHPYRVDLPSFYRLGGDFLMLYFCVDESERFKDVKHDKHRGNHPLRSSVRAQAGQAGTHTHLSAERSQWLINHKYPDSVLCTEVILSSTKTCRSWKSWMFMLQLSVEWNLLGNSC